MNAQTAPKSFQVVLVGGDSYGLGSNALFATAQEARDFGYASFNLVSVFLPLTCWRISESNRLPNAHTNGTSFSWLGKAN